MASCPASFQLAPCELDAPHTPKDHMITDVELGVLYFNDEAAD